jgi:hypothetical protein
MKPYGRVWRVLSLLSIFALSSILIQAPLIMHVDATQGTWVIEDEEVTITNATFTHEGNIVIRGTGKLLLENATLILQQIASWQFSIRLQDSAMFSIYNGCLKTVYPYRVSVSDSAVVFAEELIAPFVALYSESTTTSLCLNTSFLEARVGATSEISFSMCQIESVVTAGNSRAEINGSDIGSVHCYDQSTTEIHDSTIGTAQCDGSSQVTLTSSTLGPTWCWFTSNLSAYGCDIATLQYYDSAVVSVFDSVVESLIGAGSAPIILDSLSIGDVTLTGLANATLIHCVSDNILCDWYSILRFINGSCSRIESLDWADISVIGAPTMICNITSFGAYADTISHISWAACDAIELGHRTRTWIEDSSSYTLFNWAYGGNSSLYMSRCVIDWELRLAWDVHGTILNSTADNVLVYGASSIFASGCDFLAIQIGAANILDVTHALIQNCRIQALFPSGDANIRVESSNVSCGIRPGPGTSSTFDSLPVGPISYWNALDSGAIQGLMWNLTIIECNLDWHALIRYNSIVTFDNCNLTRLACGETSTVVATDMNIDEVQVTNYAEVTLLNSTVSDVDCGLWSTSVFMNVLISDLFTIGDSVASFYYCTIDTSLAGSVSKPYFEGCEIGWHRAGAGSSTTLRDCILGNFSSYDASINYCYNTTVFDRLDCYHVSILTLSECIISSLYVGNTAFTQFNNCSINSLTTTAYAEILCTESNIDDLQSSDSSVVTLSGNLTGIISYSITDTSSVIRQIEVLVSNSDGQRIDGALVEVYDTDDTRLVQSWTSSEGRVRFSIIFTTTYDSLMQTFRLNVSEGGRSYEGLFTIMSLVPIRVVLESSLLSTLSSDSGHSSITHSDETRGSDTTESLLDDGSIVQNQYHVIGESWGYIMPALVLPLIEITLILQNCAVSMVNQVWPLQILGRTTDLASRERNKKIRHCLMEG